MRREGRGRRGNKDIYERKKKERRGEGRCEERREEGHISEVKEREEGIRTERSEE